MFSIGPHISNAKASTTVYALIRIDSITKRTGTGYNKQFINIDFILQLWLDIRVSLLSFLYVPFYKFSSRGHMYMWFM